MEAFLDKAEGVVLGVTSVKVTDPITYFKQRRAKREAAQAAAAAAKRAAERAEKREAFADAIVHISHGAFAGAAIGAAAYYAFKGLIAAGRLCGEALKDRHRRRVLRDTKVGDRYADAALYVPETRECFLGEMHDFLNPVAPTETESESESGSSTSSASSETPPGLGDPDAPPGFARRRTPASRRVRKKEWAKMKRVHTPYVGGAVHMPYVGSVVATAKLRYGGRVATPGVEETARGFMVREMTEHGMSAFDILKHIDHMVTAVFFVSEEALKERAIRQRLRSVDCYGGDCVA